VASFSAQVTESNNEITIDMKTENRRNRMDLFSPAELAIYNAQAEVEKIGADVRLTDAGMLLQQARYLVADFIEGIDQSSPTPTEREYWYDVDELVPQTGVTVLCKLSQDIGFGCTTKKLYRMKYNGNWSDYNHLVTHWRKLGKNKIIVSEPSKESQEIEPEREQTEGTAVKSADEILKIHYVNDKWEPTFKTIVAFAEEYHNQFPQIDLRSELIKYFEWCAKWSRVAQSTCNIDEYLASRNSIKNEG
jgi:hypothetical protein